LDSRHLWFRLSSRGRNHNEIVLESPSDA